MSTTFRKYAKRLKEVGFNDEYVVEALLGALDNHEEIVNTYEAHLAVVLNTTPDRVHQILTREK